MVGVLPTGTVVVTRSLLAKDDAQGARYQTWSRVDGQRAGTLDIRG